METRFERFIYNLAEIDLYWHRIAGNVMKKFGLKGSHAIYFVKLREYPEGLTSTQISTLCSKDKADVSRDINALEAKGLLKRLQGKSSYRAAVMLTEEGKALAATVAEIANAAVETVGKDLSEEDRNVFYNSLDSITKNIRELSNKGEM